MSKIDNAYIIAFFGIAAERLEAYREELCALDGEIGDGDHGTSMASGFAAINSRLRDISKENADPSYLLRESATAFLSEVGATVGPLYATAFLFAARRLDDIELDTTQLGDLLAAIAEGIQARGAAKLGDKTMVDVWLPASQAAFQALRENGDALQVARAADAAAREGVENTVSMIASLGRASRLKERSLGHIDPGAASAAILVGAFLEIAEGET